MPDFSVRSDTINVDQIMEQIRARIREKRGVDYTEEQIREMAAVKLERFLDPQGLRSDLLERFRQRQQDQPLPSYAFEDSTLYDSHRAPLRWIRRLLQPVLKLFFNPNQIIHALHIQAQVNDLHARREALSFEVLHNLVIETTRLGIEVKNLKMRVESLTSRLEFNERRARALESVVVYKPDEADVVADEPEAPGAESDATPSPAGRPQAEGPGQRSRRRRRRRGRRGSTSAVSIMGAAAPGAEPAEAGGDPGSGESAAPQANGEPEDDREP